MENKRILFLFILVVFLTSCSQQIQLNKTTVETSTNYENDKIKIKIANNIDEKDDVYKSILDNLQKINNFSPIENLEIEMSKKYLTPNLDNIIKCDNRFIETEEFKKELIKKSYGIYDNWIVEGLYGKIFAKDTEGIDFSTYYKDHDFSLFGARFYEPFSSKEEIENIKSASIDLVEYLIADSKKEQLLKNQIEISDIEGWAEDNSIDLTYQKEIESLMNRMEVIDKRTQLIINTKEEVNGFIIDIAYSDKVNEQYDTAEKIEQIILRFDRDILAIKKGIEEDAPNFYEDYKEVLNNVPKIRYVFDGDNTNVSYSGLAMQGNARIHLIEITSQPHEYCHILFHDPFANRGIGIKKPLWLDEGIVNYLHTVYSEAYIRLIEINFQESFNLIGDSPETRDLTRDELKQVQNLFEHKLNIFSENNIGIHNIDEIEKDKNKRIIVDHVLWLTSYKIYEAINTTGELRDYLKKGGSSGLMAEGDTMHLLEDFSFVSYLIGEYGLEKILYLNVADFNQLTYEKVFGKSFEELKVDWINYLKDNIKGIDLIL